MKDLELWTLEGPSLLTARADSQFSIAALMPPSGSIVAARLDGRKLVEAHDAFEQFSYALTFPAYFGWNWDALSDCLRDLSWHPADHYLIIVDHTESMLAGNTEEREILLSILSRAAREWADPLGKPDGKGVPFKVLLLCDDEPTEALHAETAMR
ncbi:barstar family protein [Kitasatospora sp. NPDC059722]|uniref:barstar family protein n=1 Tax=unclassified Kitasatospora TaxID=2633591 RepID=UPI00365D2998